MPDRSAVPCLQGHLGSPDDILWNPFSVSGVCVCMSEKPVPITSAVRPAARWVRVVIHGLCSPTAAAAAAAHCFLEPLLGCWLISSSIMPRNQRCSGKVLSTEMPLGTYILPGFLSLFPLLRPTPTPGFLIFQSPLTLNFLVGRI